MKLRVSSIWEPCTHFPATLNKYKCSISEGTALVKGIPDKATKTCGDFGLKQLSADFLACLCCKRSSVKLVLS